MSGGEEHLAPIQALGQRVHKLRDGPWADIPKPEQVPPVDRQRELLAKWGYPYVLDEWKFHMTLTSSIPDKNTRQIFLQTLKAHFSEFTPVQLTDLCIFMQPDPATPFALMDRFPCLKQ